MTRLPLMSMLLLFPLVAAAQDSPKLARLEQDVLQLQREVLILSQLVNQLRTRADAPAAPIAPPLPTPPSSAAPASTSADRIANTSLWVDASRWRSLRLGMSELEVVGQLGPPTSMRGEDPERVLHYALQIGSSGFLAGSVTLRGHAVVAIETPILK